MRDSAEDWAEVPHEASYGRGGRLAGLWRPAARSNRPRGSNQTHNYKEVGSLDLFDMKDDG